MKDGRYWLCEVIGINYKSVVMSTMGKLQIMLLFLVAVFFGCSETDERAYVGKNSIYIRTEGDPVILAMDDEPLKATLMLIRAYDKDVSFEIDVKYLTEGAGDLVTVNPAIVTIPAGEKSVDFEIISNKKGVVADKVQLEIGVKYPLPEADMGKTISVEEIKAVSNTNLISALAMLTPGLKLVENNQAGSNPNNLPEIVIRGTSSLTTEADVNPNQPIIILDGLEITLRDLYDLDINEIERVDVLKDASASALYGERAANGVIVIERKKILNDKLRLSYNLDGTVDFPDLSTYDYLNAADKLEFERRANLYNFENKYDLEEYNRKKLLISKGMDTDWMSKPLRTGYTIGNSIGVSGKGNDMTYRVNANIRNVRGVMRGDYRNTYGISVFLSYHIANKVTVSYQSNYSGVKSKNSPYGTFSDYVTLNPYDGPYDETGFYCA